MADKSIQKIMAKQVGKAQTAPQIPQDTLLCVDKNTNKAGYLTGYDTPEPGLYT